MTNVQFYQPCFAKKNATKNFVLNVMCHPVSPSKKCPVLLKLMIELTPKKVTVWEISNLLSLNSSFSGKVWPTKSLISSRVDFTNIFTQNFYSWISQKCKKTVKSFCTFGKCACKRYSFIVVEIVPWSTPNQ